MRRLSLVLLITVAAAAADQPAVAIVEFEAKNCDQGIADAVGEILRTEIIDTGKFRVIERAQLERVIEEQSLQVSGLIDSSTAVEFGKLVGAEYVAVGSVTGLGGTFTVSVRYINVETAEAALGKTETVNNEDELPEVCRRLAAELTGLPYSGTSASSGGGRIAFQAFRGGNWEIFVMDADGSNERQLTNNSSWDYEPAWRPVE